jgi:predicted nucleic acid-binding protein
MRVFLDANILFSGAQSGSRMRAFLDVLFAHAECVTNAYAVEEARRNLELKFPATLSPFEGLVRRCELVPAFVVELPVALKAKDAPILGGAIAGRATHLLTGDQTDFGHLFGKAVQGVKVVSPRLLAEELLKLGWL